MKARTEISEIMNRYDHEDTVVPLELPTDGYQPENMHLIMMRLDRSLGNQLVEGSATFSRYVIWANTV